METPDTSPAGTTPVLSDSNSLVRALESRLRTPEAPVQSPAEEAQKATAAAEDTPVLEKPAATTVKPAEPLKKGLDALADDEGEKPAEDPVDKDDEPPADAKTPEAKNAWTKSRTEIKELKAAKAALEAEKVRLATELESRKGLADADPVKKENEALKKRVEELEPVVARTEYRKSRAYEEAVSQPLKMIDDATAALAKQYEIPESKLFDALAEPDSKRQNEMLEELTETMAGRDKNRLFRMADEWDHLAKLDEKMAQNASTALKEAQAREAADAEQKRTARRAEEMRAVVDMKDKLTKAAKFFKMDGESDDAAVKSVLDAANAVPFDEVTTPVLAYSLGAGEILPRVLKNYKSLEAKLAAAEKEIASLSGATPKAKSGTAPNAGSPEQPTDMVSALKARMAQAGLNM